MKVLMFLQSLNHGGAESVSVDIANYLSNHGFEILLVVADDTGPLKNKISNRVKLKNLNLKSYWFSIIYLPFLILKFKPDISFTTVKESNFILILANMLALSKAPVIIREANTVSAETKFEIKFYQKFKNLLIFFSYRFADHIVVLSESMKCDLLNHVNALQESRISVINNPVCRDTIKYLMHEEIPNHELSHFEARHVFISIGRLAPQKNYFFMLDALAEYKKINADFSYVIVGDGYLKDDLLKKINTLGLNENCFLIGYRSNPFKYLEKADIFLLPSLYEGMSNSLLQAVSMTKKILVSDSQPTSIEVIGEYRRGISFMSNNIEDLLSRLDFLNNLDVEDRCCLVNRYDSKSVLSTYQKLFSSIETS